MVENENYKSYTANNGTELRFPKESVIQMTVSCNRRKPMYNTKEGKSCVIYIRVSSERQVKGYSLDGQKHYLAECAERRGMTVLDTYVE